MKYPLVESIALDHGELKNLEYHVKRFEKSYYDFYQHFPPFKLFDNLDRELPSDDYYKLRITYNEKEQEISWEPYQISAIKSLKCIVDNTIDYHLKLTERSTLNHLYALRETCDDILIIKDGLVTDTFAGNIILKYEDDWYTPDKPLLEGTQRASLLECGMLKATSIRWEDLKHFTHFKVINAMRPFDRIPQVETALIK